MGEDDGEVVHAQLSSKQRACKRGSVWILPATQPGVAPAMATFSFLSLIRREKDTNITARIDTKKRL
ncbi:hypothetical protein GQ55_8G127200 [Panicum hallii var. hallii]|uniref:Uncharacterized protein n=1 Tax=Panicum hallii var. hallii TaxID=1504633 RepID=A0A2T7CMV4_9POAL|nr:hypothetical protein GQ55_8G127200 [Panicum hallii var. hallii]PUZ44679.1 hypothetical protein GQ55_8G127200 [Panicum hallii var. hallii]PUZ44680.1 hypothetical protein GQ55_8G127200 [Panicum hallii var. hallii]PUZ44681.1 hypothetical protein GQ55_8G127200 [Panicum hallii var. hallii]